MADGPWAEGQNACAGRKGRLGFGARNNKNVMHPVWEQCLDRLQAELPPTQFSLWIQPLRLGAAAHDGLCLVAPNRYIRDWVADRYLDRIRSLLHECGHRIRQLEVLSAEDRPVEPAATVSPPETAVAVAEPAPASTQPVTVSRSATPFGGSPLDPQYTFDTFVEGQSNALALVAARQVADAHLNGGRSGSLGSANPLYIYGGVGLGKTHLMHAIGQAILQRRPEARVLYLRSEQFVSYMVKAIQMGAMPEFQKRFRSLDVLMVDDIQFLAGKDRSQEEFFHTFNALIEGGQQMIFTCDRYPREIDKLEERLKSRFGWGMPVAVEPPELETRAAILLRKASQAGVDLPQETAMFMARKIRANVRELEGALTRAIASARFTRRPLDESLVRESLKDLLAVHDRMISLDNIQRTVAEYYKIRMADFSSQRRNRSIARPRQMAMALAKELTNHSLPEIGAAFGGRDHTTVLHACRKIESLKESHTDIREDHGNLLRLLTT